MITSYFLNVIIYFIDKALKVRELPVILDFDIDEALVNGMGMFRSFIDVMWPLELLFKGALVIALYYLGKMILRAMIGHRAPG